LTSKLALVAVAVCVGLGLAACGTEVAGGPVSHGRADAGCPVGRLLPAGTGESIDYVDFLRFNGRSYDEEREPVAARQLGRVITHIRCSLVAEEDQRRGPVPIIDRTASALPVGAPVYTVHGYRVGCRLAAYLDGRLHVYLAHCAAVQRMGTRRCWHSFNPAARFAQLAACRPAWGDRRVAAVPGASGRLHAWRELAICPAASSGERFLRSV
jgi:hypothetical protein